MGGEGGAAAAALLPPDARRAHALSSERTLWQNFFVAIDRVAGFTQP